MMPIAHSIDLLVDALAFLLGRAEKMVRQFVGLLESGELACQEPSRLPDLLALYLIDNLLGYEDVLGLL
jgi:hypothetical protein